jgi:hypothetical protein
MIKTLADDFFPSFYSIKRWAADFKQERENIADYPQVNLY